MEKIEVNASKEIEEESRFKSYHPRYRWLDQLRGITVLFLLVSFLTWNFSSILFLDSYPPPLGPTWMNHGFRYGAYNPSLITVIDMGSSLFMNVLGISSAIAFNSKHHKKGIGYTWVSILTRFLILFWINIAYRIFYMFFPENTVTTRGYVLLSIWIGITILLVVSRFLFLKKSKFNPIIMLCWALFSVCICYPVLHNVSDNDIFHVFFGDTLAFLAWGTFFAGLGLTLIRNPDYRIYSVFGLFTLHFVLWEILKYRNFTPTGYFVDVLPGTYFDVMGIPFDVINMAAIAISATCISDWLLQKYDDPKEGVKKRIIPYWILIFCVHFAVDFFQPGKHAGINTSLATISIFFGSLFLLIFYAWDTYFNVKLVFITPLGRNSLLMFLIQTIYLLIYQFRWSDIRSFRTQFPGLLSDFVGMLVFVVPIGFLILISWILDKLKIYVKF